MNEQTYINLYEEFSQTIKEKSAKILNNQRDTAFDKFKKQGFPTKKDEAYCYSRLPKTLGIEYGININRLHFNIDKNALFNCKIPSINAALAFLVNGNLHIADNQKYNLPKGVTLCLLSEAEKTHPEILKKYLFEQSKKSDDNFVNFNSAFSQDGYFIHIQQDTICEHPLQLISLLRSTQPLMTFSHNLIIVESGATAKILLCDHAADDVEFFESSVTEIFVENNAKLDYYTLENSNRKTNNSTQIFVNQTDNSEVVINNILLTNSTTRNSVEVDIDGKNASLFIGGMLIGDGHQEVENYTVIR
ncbi:MAG: SufD family Fe-S cluster assembly protein, partial [Prevotellaceae bacterium]|nr:SufD family Fe-S cluster assembly protein [Prevotellaceae bacterium]